MIVSKKETNENNERGNKAKHITKERKTVRNTERKEGRHT